MAPPVNDNFASAEVLTPPAGGTTSGTTLDATTEGGEPNYLSSNEQSVWYKITPTVDGFYKFIIPASSIVTKGSASFGSLIYTIFNPTVTTLAGTTRSNSLPIGSSEDFVTNSPGNGDGHVYVQLYSGDTYYLKVFSQASSPASNVNVADFDLEWELVTTGPANDDFADAMDIISLPFSDSGTTFDSSTEVGEPVRSQNLGQDQSVWYTFTPSSSAIYRFAIENVTSNSLTAQRKGGITLYSGSTVGALTEIEDSQVLFNSSWTELAVRSYLTSGVTYYIRVYSPNYNYNNFDTFDFDFSASVIPGASPPPNDDIANAEDLGLNPGGVFSGTTIGATPESFENPGGQPSVWYKFSIDYTGSQRISITKTGTDPDWIPYAEIYTVLNDPPADWDDLEYYDYLGDDYQDETTVYTDVDFVPGDYYIYLSNWNFDNSWDDFDLEFVVPPPIPPNDAFGNRIVLTSSYAIGISGTTEGATSEFNEPNTNPDNHNPPYPSVWYEWTAPNYNNSPLNFQIDCLGSPSGAATDLYLEVFTGTSLGGLTLVDSDRNSGTGGKPELTLSATGYTNYKIRVSSPPADWGTFNLNITAQVGGTPPSNDLFANAITMTGYSDSESGTTIGATSEIGEPGSTYYNETSNSVWYKWTPPQTGRVKLILESGTGTYGTIAYTYRGTALNNLQEVLNQEVSSNGAPAYNYFSVEGGQQYYFKVLGAGGYEDTFTLSFEMSSASPPANDNPTNAIVIDTDIISGAINAVTEGANWDTNSPEDYVGDFITYADQEISVWYKFVAPKNGRIFLTVDSETVYEPEYTWDLYVNLWKGANLTTAIAIDNTSSGSSQIDSPLEKGETYWISFVSTSWVTASSSSYDFIFQEFEDGGGFTPDPSGGSTGDFDSTTGGFVADPVDGEYVASGGAGLGYGTIEPWSSNGTHNPYAWYCRFDLDSTQGDFIYRYGQTQQYIEVFRATKTNDDYASIAVYGHNTGVQEIVIIDDSGSTIYYTGIKVWGSTNLGTNNKVRVELGTAGVVIDGQDISMSGPGSVAVFPFSDGGTNQFVKMDFGIRSYPGDGTSYVDIDPDWNFRYSNIRIHDDPQQDVMGSIDTTVKEIGSVHGFTTGIDYPADDDYYEQGSFNWLTPSNKPTVIASPGEYDGYCIDCSGDDTNLSPPGYSITRARNTGSVGLPVGSGFDSLFPGFSFRFYLTQFPDRNCVIGEIVKSYDTGVFNGMFLSVDQNGILYIKPSVFSEPIPFCMVNENEWNYIELQGDTTSQTYATKIWLQNYYMGRFESTYTPDTVSQAWPMLPRFDTFIVGRLQDVENLESVNDITIGVYFRDLAVTRRKIDRPLGPTVIVPISINGSGDHSITEMDEAEAMITQTNIAVNSDFSGSVDGAGQPDHWTGYDRHDTSVPAGATNSGWLAQTFGDTLLSVVSETSGPPGLESELAMRIEIPTQNDPNDDTPAACYMLFPGTGDGELLNYADVFGAVFWLKGPPGVTIYSDAMTGGGAWPAGNFVKTTGEWQRMRVFVNPNTILSGIYFNNFMYRFDGSSVGDVFYMKDFKLYKNPNGQWASFFKTIDGGATRTEIVEGETTSWQTIDEFPANTGGSNDLIYLNGHNFYPTIRGAEDDGKTHIPGLLDTSYLEYTWGDSDADSLLGVRFLIEYAGYNDVYITGSTADYTNVSRQGRLPIVVSDSDGNYRTINVLNGGPQMVGAQITRPANHHAWTLGEWNDARIRFGMHEIVLDGGVDGLSQGTLNVGVVRSILAEALVYDRKLPPPNCVRPIDLSRIRFRAFEQNEID